MTETRAEKLPLGGARNWLTFDVSVGLIGDAKADRLHVQKPPRNGMAEPAGSLNGNHGTPLEVRSVEVAKIT